MISIYQLSMYNKLDPTFDFESSVRVPGSKIARVKPSSSECFSGSLWIVVVALCQVGKELD